MFGGRRMRSRTSQDLAYFHVELSHSPWLFTLTLGLLGRRNHKNPSWNGLLGLCPPSPHINTKPHWEAPTATWLPFKGFKLCHSTCCVFTFMSSISHVCLNTGSHAAQADFELIIQQDFWCSWLHFWSVRMSGIHCLVQFMLWMECMTLCMLGKHFIVEDSPLALIYIYTSFLCVEFPTI